MSENCTINLLRPLSVTGSYCRSVTFKCDTLKTIYLIQFQVICPHPMISSDRAELKRMGVSKISWWGLILTLQNKEMTNDRVHQGVNVKGRV